MRQLSCVRDDFKYQKALAFAHNHFVPLFSLGKRGKKENIHFDGEKICKLCYAMWFIREIEND